MMDFKIDSELVQKVIEHRHLYANPESLFSSSGRNDDVVYKLREIRGNAGSGMFIGNEG